MAPNTRAGAAANTGCGPGSRQNCGNLGLQDIGTTTAPSNGCPNFATQRLRTRGPASSTARPHDVPGIGEVPGVPGFILAAGFSGHGFGIGSGAGHLIADLATGAEPIVDPVPYLSSSAGTPS
jgi:hypothetical protein